MTSSVDRNCKFSESMFSAPAIFKATSKLFSSQGCSDDKSCRYFSSIFFKICRFRNSIQPAFAVSFHFVRSDARVKFDSGVIFLDRSQFFATHSNERDCFTYGGSFDTIRVLESRPLPTLVDTRKATWQNLLSIQNEILKCKHDLIPFPSVPVATITVAPTPISSGARIVVTSTSVTIQPPFIGKWTRC